MDEQLLSTTIAFLQFYKANSIEELNHVVTLLQNRVKA